MAAFVSYDTSNSKTGQLPLQKEQEVKLELRTNKAEYIAGSIFADQSGTLKVQQSFDGEHWDISEAITFTASEGKGFRVPVIAPVAQILFTNGSTNQGVMRLFARTFVSGS